MSRRRPVSQSFLYRRPVTEWSTPPPTSTLDRVDNYETEVLSHQVRGLALNSAGVDLVRDPYHRLSAPNTTVDLKPLTPAQSFHHHVSTVSDATTDSPTLTKSHSTVGTRSAISTPPHPAQHTVSQRQHAASHKPTIPQAVPLTSSRQRVATSTPIPTALVTPLPGTSPPRHTFGLRTLHHHHQAMPGQVRSDEVEVEGVSEEGEKVWKAMEGGEQEQSGGVPELSVVPGDNIVELIEKWKALIDTKDRIMKQKSGQIERQKTTISKLQQDMHETEAKLHHLKVTQIHEHGGSALEARLQALEAENASIRAKLTEALSSQSSELRTLSSKLDRKEYELHQTVKCYTESSEESQQLVTNLRDEVHQLKEHSRKLEQKLAGAEAANKHHVERIDRLNDYMGHMPSMEEHQALEKQAREMRMQCETVSLQLAEKDTALKKALEEIAAKDHLAQSLDDVKKELEDTRLRLESHRQSLALMEPENRKLKQQCQHLQKVVVEAERRCRQELQAMRERHRARFMEATAKLRSQHKSLAKRARALETQLTKNSDAMMALNSELQFSQGTIGALKTSVKDLVSQNQDLVEKNISLQEFSAEAVKVSSSLTEAQSSAAQQLGIQLTQCVEEFESLVGLSTSLLEGQQPTSAMLFGPEVLVQFHLDLRLSYVPILLKEYQTPHWVMKQQENACISACFACCGLDLRKLWGKLLTFNSRPMFIQRKSEQWYGHASLRQCVTTKTPQVLR